MEETINNPNYQTHPELDYSKENQYQRNLDLFRHTGRILHPDTRDIYEYIRNFCIDFVKNHPQFPKFNWKPKIVDVGCGGGFGTYILSHEADFVWGIDVSENSIAWAKEVYEKNKNNIYYSSQISFDVIDIKNEPRELMKFDIVACVEVIEHIEDYEKTLAFLKRFFKTDKRGVCLEPPNSTFAFISSPNRNSDKIQKDTPLSKRHIREWTPEELYNILTKHFKYVSLTNQKGEPREFDMVDPMMLFKCETPK